jgi:hypothetical protein
MHPYMTGIMAQAHMEDLHAEAARNRLIAQARAGRPEPVASWWSRVGHAIAGARRAVGPAPAAAPRVPQATCCPA